MPIPSQFTAPVALPPNLGSLLENPFSTILFNSLPIAVYTCNNQGYIMSYNKAAESLWGRAPEIGKDIWSGSWKIYYPDGEPMDVSNSPMARTLKEGKAIEGEVIIIERPDHTKIKVKPFPVPLFNNEGLLTGAVNTLLDITRLTEGEQKEAVLAAIVNTSDDTIISKTLDGFITSWNVSAEKMFGYTAGEVIGKHISLIIPPDRLLEELSILEEISKGNKVDHFETIRIAKDGKEIPISLSVSPVMESSGKIIGASKIARNITEKKIAEEKEAILSAIVNTSDDTIVSKTLKGIITSWNKAAERMFGYTEAEVLGKHISLIIPPSRLSEEDFIIGEISKGNKIDHFETIRITKEGKEIPISLSVSAITDSSGKVIGASKIARDISAQWAAQEATRRYTEHLEIINLMVKTVSEELNLDKILQKVTDSTTDLTGAQFGVFLFNKGNESGEPHMLYTLSGASKKSFDKFEMPMDTKVFNFTFSDNGVIRYDDITKDPQYQNNTSHYGIPLNFPVVSYLAVPVISRSGKLMGGLFFGHSAPGRFTAEHENILVSVAAHAAIGIDNALLFEEVKALNDKKDEFIGLASHELKTPLTSISGYLQILSRLKMEESSRKFVEKTIQQVKKLTALVSDLLDVSKIEAGKLQLGIKDFDIKTVVEDAIELIQHSYNGSKISFETDIKHLTLSGDPDRIEQVLINLMTNAIKYSKGNAVIEVVLIAGKKEVKVGVKDFGVGIDSDKLSQIFTRFYRVEDANPTVSGLGIGLYLSNEIITRHKGQLWAESEPGEGSTFWFTLPLIKN